MGQPRETCGQGTGRSGQVVMWTFRVELASSSSQCGQGDLRTGQESICDYTLAIYQRQYLKLEAAILGCAA
jgi:hypothetical protein